MPKPISNDSTLRTVWPHLTHQREYVAGVRHKAERCNKEHGNAFVKIGVTGTGQKPCYRVFYKSEDSTEKIYGSYWDTHQPLDNEKAINTNWSTAAMTYDEVHLLMLEKHPPRKLSASHKVGS